MKKGRTRSHIEIYHYVAEKKSMFILMMLGYVLNFCANVVFTFITAHLLEAIGQGRFDDIIFYATIEFITVLSMRLFWGMSYYCDTKLQAHCIIGMQKKCNKKMFEISSPIYSSSSSGLFLNRIVSKPANVFAMFENIMSSAMWGLTSVAVVGYIAFMDWTLGLIIVASFALSALLIYFHNKLQVRLYTKLDNVENDFNTTILEAIRGARDVKCLNLQENVNKEMSFKADKYTFCDTKAQSMMTAVNVIEKIIILATAILLVYVGMFRYENSFITILSLVYIVANYSKVQEFVYNMIDICGKIKRYKMEMARISQLSDENIFKIEHFGTQELVNPQGKIEFKDIYAKYKLYPLNTIINADLEPNKKKKAKLLQEIEQEKGKTVKSTLNGVSFTIEPNTRVAIVGKSGEGKTTIVSLLNRLIDPTSGEILIDDINVRDLSRDALRNTVTIVNQFPYVYDMSIKDNLKLSNPNATDEEIADVVKRAYLSEFVDKLPYKLDTIIGENGVKLSGGQKQRLAIARALLKNTKIIVFDESTSSLDNFAQKHVQESIDNLHDKTVIIIAHRLSTIIDCDKIIFIDDGQVKAVGTFNELISKNKDFSNLYKVGGEE